jgi:Glycosyl hydrolase catalytic core
MKKIPTLILAFWVCQIAHAQLTIYAGLNQQGSSATCVARTIYTDATIPNTLDNRIRSITLNQGFMAVLAENADGSGEGFNYIASVSNINVNLAGVLQNKVSFIRVLPIMANLKKKGAGSNDPTNVTANLLGVSWLYDWGAGDASTATREFVPMAWGRGAASTTNVTSVINKPDVTCYLAFNEPDNADQSNIPFADAVPLYKNMLRSGMRMGTPAPTENQYRFWLQDFTDLAESNNYRIDFVAVHWYDWGNWTSSNPDNNATNIFNRFKSYVNAVYTRYGKPIWITEFNANVNRTTAVHEAFMRLALPWLETNTKVERYAYFFPTAIPAVSNGALTAAGQIYSDQVSTNAYPANVVDTRSTVVPVELYGFKGSHISPSGGQGAGNLLTWHTASEIKNSHFDIERSNDGNNFEKIGTVKGNGTSQKAQDYEFLDKQPEALNYYRLRQVDIDGKYAFSPIISLKKKSESREITPSVSDQVLSIDMPFTQATVIVSDMLGRILLAQTISNGQTIDISRLTTGHYVVSVAANSDKATARFFKN